MRRLALLWVLALTGQAQSQRAISNLEMLDPIELCGPYVILTIDGKQDWPLSIELTKMIRDFGTESLSIDTFSDSETCTYMSTINVFASKTNLDSIIYGMEFSLQVNEAIFKDIFGETHKAKNVYIYSKDYLGISADMEAFSDSLNIKVLEVWEGFAKDWNSVKHFNN